MDRRTLRIAAAIAAAVVLLVALTVQLAKERARDKPAADSGAGTAASAEPSVHLALGNPGGAEDDPGDADDFLMRKPHFALSFRNASGTPNWAGWCLRESDLGSAPRAEFRPDADLPSGFHRVVPGITRERVRPRPNVSAQRPGEHPGSGGFDVRDDEHRPAGASRQPARAERFRGVLPRPRPREAAGALHRDGPGARRRRHRARQRGDAEARDARDPHQRQGLQGEHDERRSRAHEEVLARFDDGGRVDRALGTGPHGKTASAEACREMLGHLRAGGDRETLPRYLSAGTVIAHKTGATDRARTAAGIIEIPDPKGGKNKIPIALCVLTSENADERWVLDNAAQVTIAKIAKAAYDRYSAGGASEPEARDDRR